MGALCALFDRDHAFFMKVLRLVSNPPFLESALFFKGGFRTLALTWTIRRGWVYPNAGDLRV